MSYIDMNKFKSIKGFSRYLISNNGNIYSTVRNRILPPHKNWAGYLTVTLINDENHRSPRKIHRLVYQTYVGPLENGKVVDHIDNDKLNNLYTNLKQITPSENSSKSFISGKNKDKVIWPKEIIHKICKLLEDQYSVKDIFNELGIDFENNKYNCSHLIGDILRGTIHKDVSCQYDLSGYVHGVNKKDAKLNINKVQQIYIRLLIGEKPTTLAKYFFVNFSTICKIRDGKTWQNVTNPIRDAIANGEMYNDYSKRLRLFQ